MRRAWQNFVRTASLGVCVLRVGAAVGKSCSRRGRGKYQVRLLTARECARLQGVPDTYVIDVPLNQALFGFGDAVCVPAVEWIAKNYLTPAALAMRKPMLFP